LKGIQINHPRAMLELIKTLYAYNSWATGQLLTALDQLTEEEHTAPGCSGHGSIRDTLAHFIGTQWSWFSWFDGSITAAQSIGLKVTSEEVNTSRKRGERWQAVDKQTRDCLDKLTEESVRQVWSATLPSGFVMALPLWQLLLHVANHGTHTRAQIVAAIRRLGHAPGVFEFFRFVVAQQR
jgi:uncharacterized damage-inducible protein DinB